MRRAALATILGRAQADELDRCRVRPGAVGIGGSVFCRRQACGHYSVAVRV
jgi:hypothetical protein